MTELMYFCVFSLWHWGAESVTNTNTYLLSTLTPAWLNDDYTCCQHLQVCLTWKTFTTKLDAWPSWQPSAHCVGWIIHYDTLFLWISCKQLDLHMHGLILFHFSAADLWLWSLNTKETLWHLPCSQRHCFSDTSQQCYIYVNVGFAFRITEKQKLMLSCLTHYTDCQVALERLKDFCCVVT